MNRPISLAARMSLLFALSAAAVLMIAGVIFERALNERLLKRDGEELSGKMELVRDIVLAAHKFEDVSDLPVRLNDVVFGHPGMVISVRTETSAALFSVGSEQVAKQLQDEVTAASTEPVTKEDGGHFYRILSSRVMRAAQEGGPVAVMIALDITEDHDFVAELQKYFWFGMAQVILVLCGLAWIVVRHGLAPLRKVSAAVAAISTRQLDKPLEEKGVPKELRELAMAFNAMLARLHESFRRLADFSSDIAHELRTPIHNLLIQTQVTLGDQDNIDSYRAVLQSNEEEYQRLSGMISDMLFLAKADNKQASLRKEPLELQTEVAKLFDFYDALASELGIELQQTGSATVSTDRLMMQRALSNLLSNAIRFTPRGMAIKVSMGTEDGWAILAISNPGPDIPADQRERIFERLYRIDPSRREGHTDNVGLGLAITKSIVEMHGGQISVTSQDGQVIFLLSIPLAPTV